MWFTPPATTPPPDPEQIAELLARERWAQRLRSAGYRVVHEAWTPAEPERRPP